MTPFIAAAALWACMADDPGLCIDVGSQANLKWPVALTVIKTPANGLSPVYLDCADMRVFYIGDEGKVQGQPFFQDSLFGGACKSFFGEGV